MNINYPRSVAERFVKYRTGLLETAGIRPNLFNAISIYIPSFLAASNIIDYDGSGLTDAVPIVKVATLDNYTDVMKGQLLAQYAAVFNEGTNPDVVIYLIVFNADDAASVQTDIDTAVTATSISYEPLKNAFDELYFVSFFKTMFSESYNGVGTDAAYYDLALCLAYLCNYEPTLSECALFTHITLPLEAVDTNVCKILSVDRAAETTACTALNPTISGVTRPRDDYFWGMLNFIGCANTWLIVHSEQYNMIPIAIAKWFQVGKNGSGEYVGNKLSNIRLSGNRVKPTGTPSFLNADVNTNLAKALYDILDAKNVSYLVSISDATPNDSELVRAMGIQGVPVNARMIAKFIDYNCSQDVADWITAFETGTKPVLRNESTYEILKNFLIVYLQKFIGSPSRLTDLSLNFPDYANLPASKTDITVTSGWTARYVDDLISVFISGSIIY